MKFFKKERQLELDFETPQINEEATNTAYKYAVFCGVIQILITYLIIAYV